jgi:hypothetical protein
MPDDVHKIAGFNRSLGALAAISGMVEDERDERVVRGLHRHDQVFLGHPILWCSDRHLSDSSRPCGHRTVLAVEVGE